MSGKYIAGALATAALAGALVYFYGGSQAPAGQAPLQSLTSQNVAEIKNAFNAANGDARVLVLLSPT
jgi:hypothetical protein